MHIGHRIEKVINKSSGVLNFCGCWFSDGLVKKTVLYLKKWCYVGLRAKVVTAVGFSGNLFSWKVPFLP